MFLCWETVHSVCLNRSLLFGGEETRFTKQKEANEVNPDTSCDVNTRLQNGIHTEIVQTVSTF